MITIQSALTNCTYTFHVLQFSSMHLVINDRFLSQVPFEVGRAGQHQEEEGQPCNHCVLEAQWHIRWTCIPDHVCILNKINLCTAKVNALSTHLNLFIFMILHSTEHSHEWKYYIHPRLGVKLPLKHIFLVTCSTVYLHSVNFAFEHMICW